MFKITSIFRIGNYGSSRTLLHKIKKQSQRKGAIKIFLLKMEFEVIISEIKEKPKSPN